MTIISNRPRCICGCGLFPTREGSRYISGHDAKLAHKVATFLEEHGIADVDELLKRVALSSGP
jgi:hypothetical protein